LDELDFSRCDGGRIALFVAWIEFWRGTPETKRIYQLSMVEQVREAMEKANQKVYGGRVTVH